MIFPKKQSQKVKIEAIFNEQYNSSTGHFYIAGMQ